MKVKEDSEIAGLKLNIQNMKVMTLVSSIHGKFIQNTVNNYILIKSMTEEINQFLKDKKHPKLNKDETENQDSFYNHQKKTKFAI